MYTRYYLIAVALSVVAALVSASHSLFVRLGTNEGRTDTAILLVMVINVVVLGPLVLVFYYPDYGLSLASLLSFAVAGLLGTMLGRALMYRSIEDIGASRTAPIIASWALFSSVLGVVFLDETLSIPHGVGIVVVILGVAVIARETSDSAEESLLPRESIFKVFLPLGAAIAFGSEPIIANHGFDRGTPAPVGLLIKTVAGTAGFVVYLRWRNGSNEISSVRGADLKWYVLAGIASTLFLLLYYVAIEMAPVSVVVPIIVTNTLFVVVLSSVLMPGQLETVTRRLVAASVVVVAGVVLITVF